ncbi:MAG: YajQ family cyclic di-GMP-binding protein [Methylococcaceae bacterium]|nr:YajQ family cyclic di-GMP-binding protein [Methylococcaceae bacterium]
MPSFDIVSEYDQHEARNAVDQANKEITTRFDFKGVDASFVLNDDAITVKAAVEFQLQQMSDILQAKLVKRGIDIACMELSDVQARGKTVSQIATLKQGLDTLLAKKIVKLIKDKKLKVQSAIQGEKVRVTGKKRDDLQQVMAMLKAEKLDMPLQFDNFRD